MPLESKHAPSGGRTAADEARPPTGADPHRSRRAAARALAALLGFAFFATHAFASYPIGSRLQLDAKGRMRFRYVSSDTTPVIGVYGETLDLGYDHRGRLELGLAYRFSDAFRVGAAVRLSNELALSLLPPPDLISTVPVAGWWWANYQRGFVDARAGAFDASFTPLTFMRWDLNDNALGTGGSCCAVAIAGLGQYSLEPLTPDYRMEGARLLLTPGPLTATLLFARAGLPVESRSFDRYLAGARASVSFGGLWSENRGAISGTVFHAGDDLNSVQGAATTPLRSDVAGADVDLPLVGDLALTGEYAYSWRDDNLRLADPETRGPGLMAGLRFGDRQQRDAQLTFLRTDPDFNPLFRALSYNRNRQGVRALFSLRKQPLGTRTGSLTLFAKYLKELTPMYGAETTGGRYRGSFLDLAATLRYDLAAPLTLGLDSEWRRNDRRNDELTPGYDEATAVSEVIGAFCLTYRVVESGSVMLRHTLTSHREAANAYHGRLSYLTQVPSIEVLVSF